ncbi:MAG: hypothetical protein AAF487_14700 [Bacteroidota bacterium]
MDILKVATEWAKAELVSTSFFIIVGIVFAMASFGFWQFGKTDLARAYIIPILVAGIFLMTVGFGLFFTNKARISQFEMDYSTDAKAFVISELERTEATLKEYKNIVFTAIPFIILACGLLIFFLSAPIWRASMISTVAMLCVILIIDGLAHARIDTYAAQLMQAKQEMKR